MFNLQYLGNYKFIFLICTVYFILSISIIHFTTNFWHIYSLQKSVLRLGFLRIIQTIAILKLILNTRIVLLRIKLIKPKNK